MKICKFNINIIFSVVCICFPIKYLVLQCIKKQHRLIGSHDYVQGPSAVREKVWSGLIQKKLSDCRYSLNQNKPPVLPKRDHNGTELRHTGVTCPLCGPTVQFSSLTSYNCICLLKKHCSLFTMCSRTLFTVNCAEHLSPGSSNHSNLWLHWRIKSGGTDLKKRINSSCLTYRVVDRWGRNTNTKHLQYISITFNMS